MVPLLTLALAAGAAPAEVLVVDRTPEGAGELMLRQAKALRYGQRWFEAGQLYRRYIQENPGGSRLPEARFWLAATLESDQRWDEAAEAYTVFLDTHPEQRLLGREAKLNRIRCWGLRQGQAPGATPGLLTALNDPSEEVAVAAALQLAKSADRRAVAVLQRGLALPASADACSTALIALGVKPAQSQPAAQGRYLVIRVKEANKPDTVTIRLALVLAKAVTNYLSDAQLRELQAKGVDLGNLTERAATMAKGTLLFSVDDGKSSVAVTVE
jgi:tetratricopeptide (TPR) repeat protein